MSRPRMHPAAPRGFALIAVLIVISLMLTMGLTWMQHSALDESSALSGREMSEATEAIDSSIALVREDLAAGASEGHRTLTIDGRTTEVTVSGLDSDGRRRWDLVSHNAAGLGTTLLAESARVSAPEDEGGVAHPDRLPTLEGTVLTAVLGDPTVKITSHSGHVRLQDVTLDGIHVLEKGATLTVSEVVLNGSVVSRAALEASPVGDHDPDKQPTLVIDGSFLVEPGAALPDVAILIPDGTVTTAAGLEERYQILGAVVAHTVELTSKGTLSGALVFVSSILGDELLRPGFGREPLELPAGLDAGAATQDEFLAFLPLEQKAADLTQLSGFFDKD